VVEEKSGSDLTAEKMDMQSPEKDVDLPGDKVVEEKSGSDLTAEKMDMQLPEKEADLSVAKVVKEKLKSGRPIKKADIKKEKVIAALAKEIQLSRSTFFSLLNKLSLRHLMILKDIFQKERFETNDEKKILRRLLSKLPEVGISLIKFLTTLTEEEIEYLLSVNRGMPSVTSALEIRRPDIFYEDTQPERIYLENAGLCLIAVYLPGLFRQLSYLEDKLFKNRALATRALFLLQYIASGKNKNPEYLLQFNKLLCGIPVEDYITGSVRLTKKEISEANNLIQSVIENWKTLKNTSIQGFRESFLQRKGILFETELYWTLQVERKGYDLLLNSIPWSFGMIKLPWMKKHIQVEW